MRTLDALVELTGSSYAAIGSPRHVLLGLSGGADSIALFFVLDHIRQSYGFDISCIHVHHGLRAAADGDARFVSDLCRRHSVRLFTKRVEVCTEGSLEAAARKARYAAFREVMHISGATVLALAHHADDQAETMLMRLMHGAGMKGLSAMRPFQDAIWRPLLDVEGQVLRSMLTEEGIAWREDESNAEDVYLRNAIRHLVLPKMRMLAPHCVRSMSRTAAILQDEDDFLDTYAQTWLRDNASTRQPYVFVMTAACRELQAAVQRRVIRLLCAAQGIDLTFDQTDAVRTLLADDMKGNSVNLPGGCKALRTETRLHILPAQHVEQVALEGYMVMGEASPGVFGDGKREQAVPLTALHGACLRFRRPGDVIRPLGMLGTQTLKEYMIAKKVDQPFRDGTPLLACGNRILWVVGTGISQEAAVINSTRQCILLRYMGPLPADIT
jgi:tRNA(Ile)-lysidine synthase